MTLTRDQLRAARMLFHLRQETLADLSEVALATIKRFETGNAIRPTQVEKLRVALTGAGAVLICGGVLDGQKLGGGVALLSDGGLPQATRARIAEEERRDAERVEADRPRRETYRTEPKPERPRGRGRPRKKGPEEGSDDRS